MLLNLEVTSQFSEVLSNYHFPEYFLTWLVAHYTHLISSVFTCSSHFKLLYWLHFPLPTWSAFLSQCTFLSVLPPLIYIVSWLQKLPIDLWLPVYISSLFFSPHFQMPVSKSLMGISKLASSRLFFWYFLRKPDLLAFLNISTYGNSIIVAQTKNKETNKNCGAVLGTFFTHTLHLIQL